MSMMRLLQPTSVFVVNNETNATRFMNNDTVIYSNGTVDFGNGTIATADADAGYNDAAVLRNTVSVYGSVLAITWIVFCWVRLRYPRAYTIRKWTSDAELKTPLADDQFGFFSWAWMLNAFTDDEILQHCGLDALCFLRTLSMGFRICLLGMFNSLWLFPVYATAPTSTDTVNIDDAVVMLSVAHVPAGSARLIATTVAAYMTFGYTMYLIVHEFKWFGMTRHKYLSLALPANYSVYVRNIPTDYQSNAGLARFFRACFGESAVAEARIRVSIPNLAKIGQERQVCIQNLEMAVAKQDVLGITEKANDSGGLGAVVGKLPSIGAGLGNGDSNDKNNMTTVELYTQELKELNADITERITTLERDMADRDRDHDETAKLQINKTMSFEEGGDPNRVLGIVTTADEDDEVSRFENATEDNNNNGENGASGPLNFRGLTKGLSSAKNLAGAGLGAGLGAVGNVAGAVGNLVTGGASDGEPFSAGFVSFDKLSTTQAALQMVHFQEPFNFEVTPAPHPDDVFWSNVGKNHKELQVGKLLSTAATVATCLLWTIPMAFVSSLSSIEGLEGIDFIRKSMEAAPFLRPLLEILAPFFIVIFNGMLSFILQTYSKYEGPVSGSVLEALTFAKLAAFMIIQTFLVTALSGSLMKELEKIANDFMSVFTLLANTLPAQSTFFTQITFVSTVMFLLFENLRIVAVVLAFVRSLIGPKITEKQRQTAYMGIRPLADPVEFEHASNMAQITVLNFVIMLVYQPIAPLTSFFMGFCFWIMRPAFLHQFVYIYPRTIDSGGVIWTIFIKIVLTVMLAAQLIITAVLGLKQGAIAATMMFPLNVTTVLFNAYIRQEHFRVAQFLPSFQCLQVDNQERDLAFLDCAYLEEPLQEKEKFPDDLSKSRLLGLGLVPSNPEEPSEVSEMGHYGDAHESEAAMPSSGILGSIFGSSKK